MIAPMNRDRWERVAHLYQAALERPISDRTTFLLNECQGDADLQRDVESLLAEDLRAGPLDRPVWESAAELLDDRIRLAAGTCLGPYRLDRMVGAGGMGEVYRATNTRLDRTVAIKILPADVSTDAEFRERFDREAKAIAALSHPHICTLYDIGHHDTIDFLVLEYLEGETLAARLEKQT
jgi:serine/threonine protein kinase